MFKDLLLPAAKNSTSWGVNVPVCVEETFAQDEEGPGQHCHGLLVTTTIKTVSGAIFSVCFT